MNKILLLLENHANRNLLADWLGGRYEVVAGEDRSLSDRFDLGILDGQALERNWEQALRRKKVEHPVFLPFLFVASRRNISILTRQMWKGIDDLIYTPIDKAELQARVEVLLRGRRYSVELEERYHHIAERSAACVYILQEGRIVYANPVLLQKAGLPLEGLSGRSHLTLYEKKDHGRIDAYVAAAAAADCGDSESSGNGGNCENSGNCENGENGENGGHCREKSLEVTLRLPGEPCWVSLHAMPIVYFDRPAAMMTAYDISERRRMHQELRRLSGKLLSAQESERKLIAMDLHDTVAQSLTATKMTVEIRAAAIKRGNEESAPSLESIASGLKNNIDEVRRIMADLWPRSIDHLGIVKTLENRAADLKDAFPGIRVETRLDLPESDIPDNLKIVIYRVAQEALSNAAKHGGAGMVRIVLEDADGGIRMIISDDGVGFDPESAGEDNSDRTGVGLSSMRERVYLSGGVFTLRSSPGQGAELIAEWPESAAYPDDDFMSRPPSE